MQDPERHSSCHSLGEPAERAGTCADRADAAELRADAAERLAVVGRMAMGVVHEVRNPLTFVGMNLRSAVDRLDASGGSTPALEALREELEDALGGARRMEAIVEQLGVFANVRRTRAYGSAVDGATLAVRLSQFAVLPGLQVRVNAPTGLPFVSMAEGALSQVLLNLIVNASDAIEASGRSAGRVDVTIERAGDELRLRVSDNGPGIAPSVRGSLFEPSSTTKPAGKGTGLGLSIVDRMVREAGGTVTLQQSKVGACFQVALPIAPGDANDAPGTTHRPERRPLILIIDDELALCRAMARWLRRDFDVALAADPGEAQMLLAGGLWPDAILCDADMPYMNGLEFYAWLGKGHPGLQPRFLLMTGDMIDPSRRRRQDDYKGPVLAKPFDLRELRVALTHLTQCERDPPSETGDQG